MNKKFPPGFIKNFILIFILIALIVLPFWFAKDHKFIGTDDIASKAITEINTNYKPWFQSLWSPPGKEIESLLFALQAAIGAGFIGYYIGLMTGRSKK
ncbi:MAG: energy-coupling factor ABC transporter substrate-binding protein [Spirochaetia bacterium]|nr:energy-coupling factor ABC transporter substrate-binding protein [Spirochaetia bacterium]